MAMRTMILLLAVVASAWGQTSPIASKTAGMTKLTGYFPIYLDARTGKIYLEIDNWNEEFLYVNSLPAGVGSNDIGLDRGQIGGTQIVKFERSGPKVLLVQPNYSFRATSSNDLERASVEQAFAQSVLFGFTVEAEEGRRALVDATAFFLRDAHHVPQTLAREKQGKFTLDPSRCALYPERTRNFLKNTEVEATLTFAGEEPGAWVREVTPSPDAVTVREHHSFIALPDANFRPREFDPRAGYFGLEYMDFSAPVESNIHKRLIARHRLIKKDPAAEISDPVEPLVYYLDPGVPEPVRSALIEGASWWEQAFEAAGFRNAFQVKMLPSDADPMDIRFNLIQWVHRSTRGWSYGEGVIDPRTGEIIKGQVTLGSLRHRQDYLIASGLIADFEDGKQIDPRMAQMAYARIRQLAAHEVGHTLGLAHNYIASTRNRSSVMDYPPPYVKLNGDGQIDLSDAYAKGIGEWDKIAIDWGYREFPKGTEERPRLDRILSEASKRGLIFLSDEDARPQGSAHPANHLWDSGENAVTELKRILQVRAVAIGNFDERKILPGAPMSSIEDVFAPVYMYHRYQTEAAAKVLGGLDYTYALRGDGQKVTEIVAPEEQRRALDALLLTLDAKTLDVPERILKLIPPPAHEFTRTREDFHGRTGVTFDAMAPVEAAADLTAGLMLNAERASRLVQYHARDVRNPSLEEVVDKLLAATWKTARADALTAETGRTIDNVVLFRLMSLAADNAASEQARAIAFSKLQDLRSWLRTAAPKDSAQGAHFQFAAHEIEYFSEHPAEIRVSKPADPPDGPPIGSDSDFGLQTVREPW